MGLYNSSSLGESCRAVKKRDLFALIVIAVSSFYLFALIQACGVSSECQLRCELGHLLPYIGVYR